MQKASSNRGSLLLRGCQHDLKRNVPRRWCGLHSRLRVAQAPSLKREYRPHVSSTRVRNSTECLRLCFNQRKVF
jgi:hypothetical protein